MEHGFQSARIFYKSANTRWAEFVCVCVCVCNVELVADAECSKMPNVKQPIKMLVSLWSTQHTAQAPETKRQTNVWFVPYALILCSISWNRLYSRIMRFGYGRRNIRMSIPRVLHTAAHCSGIIALERRCDVAGAAIRRCVFLAHEMWNTFYVLLSPHNDDNYPKIAANTNRFTHSA